MFKLVYKRCQRDCFFPDEPTKPFGIIPYMRRGPFIGGSILAWSVAKGKSKVDAAFPHKIIRFSLSVNKIKIKENVGLTGTRAKNSLPMKLILTALRNLRAKGNVLI